MSRDLEGKKSLQQSLDFEWEESLYGVSWMPEGKSVLVPSSGEILSRHTTCWTCKKIAYRGDITQRQIGHVYPELEPQINWSDNPVPPSGRKPSGVDLCVGESHHGPVSRAGVILSSEYGWQLPSRVVFLALKYGWKDPCRGKL